MYHSEEVIRQLQSQKVLAMKLDRAVRAVGEEVKQHVSNIGAGAQRLLNYTSCLTDEYYDVCTKQHLEDSRFRKGIVHLVTRRNIVSEMISAYVEEMVKDFSPDQLAEIQRILIHVNVYISTSSLTSYAFATGVATAISLHVTLPLSGLEAAAGLTSAVVGSLGRLWDRAACGGKRETPADSASRLLPDALFSRDRDDVLSCGAHLYASWRALSAMDGYP